ncbi:MAG TPA: hypothetical protein VK667_14370 [Ktedonobacteraceae bacterium]|nr:hypothetical protein [Ktedonobacteraceae bacterium]
MEITHTASQDETSVTVTRENGERVDFCHMPKLNEIVIGQTSGDSGDEHIQIVLSPKEAIALAEHIILTVVSA